MKNNRYWIKIGVFLIFIFELVFQTACEKKKMSVINHDSNAGFNGGFENSKENLPLNWIIYCANTVPEGDFEINMDKISFYEGVQSLHFKVKNCSKIGGRFSPGIAKEISVKPGSTYRISLWVKNYRSEFLIKTGGVTKLNGKLEKIIQSKEKVYKWKKIEYKYTVPQKMNILRFELNILQAGEFWVDNIIFQKVS